MTQAQKQKHYHQKVSKKCKTGLVVSIGLVLLLVIVKMILSNRAATWGRNLNSIKRQTAEIKKQNLEFKSQIAQKSGGLEKLTDKAFKNNFTTQPEYMYFPQSLNVAQVLP